MTAKTFKLTKYITILSVILLSTSCSTNENYGFGFINSHGSNSEVNWVITVIFLIIIFLPVLFSLLFIKGDSGDWGDTVKPLSFIYGGIAALILIINVVSEDKWNDGATWMLLTTIVALIVGFYAANISKKKLAVETKCPMCNQLSAMQQVNKVFTRSRSTTVDRTIETKNKNGDVIATTRVPVPATRYYYNIHSQCQFCKHLEIWETSEVYAD